VVLVRLRLIICLLRIIPVFIVSILFHEFPSGNVTIDHVPTHPNFSFSKVYAICNVSHFQNAKSKRFYLCNSSSIPEAGHRSTRKWSRAYKSPTHPFGGKGVSSPFLSCTRQAENHVRQRGSAPPDDRRFRTLR
jgi:hypothetical protein